MTTVCQWLKFGNINITEETDWTISILAVVVLYLRNVMKKLRGD